MCGNLVWNVRGYGHIAWKLKIFYNLQNKLGWYVSEIKTDQDVGGINEFIEKEGKWFNYIKGRAWE